MVGKIYLPSMHANMCIAFEKTSLNKYVQTFKKFVKSLPKDTTSHGEDSDEHI
jgi:hypothetical protein